MTADVAQRRIWYEAYRTASMSSDRILPIVEEIVETNHKIIWKADNIILAVAAERAIQ